MGASVLGGGERLGPGETGTGGVVAAGEPASVSALNRQGWVPALLNPPPYFPPSCRPDKPLLSEGQPSA